MTPPHTIEPVDYLVIGHISLDHTPQGPKLGGTVAYAGLTAHNMGLKVGIVTSWGEEIPLGPLEPLSVASIRADHSTSFENVYTEAGRRQFIRHLAPRLDFHHIPEPWRNAAIVHLGPIAQEVEPNIVNYLPASFLCATSQGWLREWDHEGRVSPSEWPEYTYVLSHLEAAIISDEDVGKDERRIDELAAAAQLLVVTEAADGARVYWNGEMRAIKAPPVEAVDATGSGDIFAAVFFIHYQTTGNAWEAAEMATHLATLSTTRTGLAGVPTVEEIQAHMPASMFGW